MRMSIDVAERNCEMLREELNAGVPFGRLMFVVACNPEDKHGVRRFTHVEVRDGRGKVLIAGQVHEVSRWIGGFRACFEMNHEGASR